MSWPSTTRKSRVITIGTWCVEFTSLFFYKSPLSRSRRCNSCVSGESRVGGGPQRVQRPRRAQRSRPAAAPRSATGRGYAAPAAVQVNGEPSKYVHVVNCSLNFCSSALSKRNLSRKSRSGRIVCTSTAACLDCRHTLFTSRLPNTPGKVRARNTRLPK